MPRRFLMSHRLIPSVLACEESLVMNDSFSASIRGETLQIWSVILENTQLHAQKKNENFQSVFCRLHCSTSRWWQESVFMIDSS